MYVTREGEVRDKLFSVQDNLSTVWLINGHFILSSTIVASLLEALMAVLDNLDKPMTSNVISVRTTFHGTGDYLTYDAKNRKNLETILTTNVPKTAIHTHIRLDYGEIRRKYANEAILSHYM